ncbi:hypothetical protein GA0070558_104151 [Micromonospora haikouensis]|uniref:Uncharacterized protein n=1 Tax=Micromonospora haikouensis TaxID=686309 RepID=A0A1C4UNE2_9ACTN|nr:hypothetical protein GA0070558_104151 [Micromonospora haikouensis]
MSYLTQLPMRGRSRPPGQWQWAATPPIPGKSNGRAASRRLASRRWAILTGAPWSSADTTRCHATTERTMPGTANTLRGSPLCTDATRVDLPSSTCPCPSSPASSGASSPGCARVAGCWPPSATAPGRAPRRTGSAAPPPCGGAMPTRRPTAPGCGRSSGGAQPCRAGGGIPAAGYPHVADMAGPARAQHGPSTGPARGSAPPSAGSGRRSLSISRRLWCAVSRCVAPGGWSMHSMNFHDWRARSECSPNEGPRGTRERRGITPPGRASCRSVGLVAVQAEPGHRGLCCPQCVWHHHGIFTPPVLPVS